MKFNLRNVLILIGLLILAWFLFKAAIKFAIGLLVLGAIAYTIFRLMRKGST